MTNPRPEQSTEQTSPVEAPPLNPAFREVLFALSLANLCFLSTWFGPLYNTQQGYFNKIRVNAPTLLALLVNLLAFAALTWVVVRLVRKHPRWPLVLGAHLLFFAALIPPLEFLRIHVFEIADFQVVSFFVKPAYAAISMLVASLLVWQHRRVARFLGILVGLLSPLAVLTIARILTLLVNQPQAAKQWSTPSLRPPAALTNEQARVVWVLFDEMDYRLAFEEPLPGLRLKEFDRLKGEALFASHAMPPADCTSMSIPALTTGKRVSGSTTRGASKLELEWAENGGKAFWSGVPTTFSEAQALGRNTAVVGWFHPYDRLFPEELNYCSWYPIYMFEYVRARTFSASLKRQFLSLGEALYARHIFRETCRQTIADALSVVTNKAYGLAFLHLPPPHTPGIYNPDKDQFTIIPVPKPIAYRNNLMLADRTLGQIRAALEAGGQWDRTWLIVSSDHFWRRSKVYDGRSDVRIPFVLKSPGSNAPVLYSREFNTVATHELILAILRGAVTNQVTAVSWMDEHAKPLATMFYKGPGEAEAIR